MDNYFTHSIEYPGEDLLNGVECGVLYYYVVKPFLDGALGLVGDRCAAWLLERYDAFDPARMEAIKAKCSENPARWIGWDEFADDVIVLARSSARGEWYLFWFDSDVSDCRLGRFRTDDPLETICGNVEAWIESITDRSQEGVVRTDGAGDGWETLTSWRRLPDEWARRLSFGD